MSITRIKSYGISDGAITTSKISGDVSLGVKIANVQIANSSYTVLDDTAVSVDGGYIIINGAGFASGCQVIIGSNAASSVTFVDSSTIRAQVGAAEAGSKIMYVTNPDGGTAIRLNALTYSGTPTWVTGSTLTGGSVDEAISIQLSATSDSNVSYQVQSGSTLPTGLSLAANGLLSGTVTGIEDETTYNFTIEAIDAENQESPRSFSITITFGDEYFNYTTLLLSGDGTNGANNNVFTDSSTNNFAITRNGNATQGTFSPFSVADGAWSNYFDGSGDYLANTSTVLITTTANTFTIEGWIYMTADPTSGVTNISGFIAVDGQPAATTNYMSFGPVSSRVLYLRWFDGAGKTANGSTTLNLNQWYHIACVVNAGSIQFYVNGVAESMSGTTTLTNRSGTTSNFSIGQNYYAAISGYISNLRVATTAVYTTGFTPSTSPLTAITNTSLLTCQSNRFVDNSTNTFAITPAGNVKVTSFSPFRPTAAYSAATNGGSGYFDGTGDYLNLSSDAALTPANGDFCIECWIYPTAAFDTYNGIFVGNATNGFFFGKITGGIGLRISGVSDVISATAPNINQWTHIAITRSGTDVRLFYNGVQQGSTVTNSTNFAQSATFIGDNGASNAIWEGYISNLRFVKGTAVYTTAFTPLTAPLTAITNTSLLCNFTDAGIFDATGKNNLETIGNAQIDTTTKKYGTGSMEFNGTTDALFVPNGIALGSGSWTIESWVYRSSTGATRAIFGHNVAQAESTGLILVVNSSENFAVWWGNAYQASVSGFPSSEWVHIAATYDGTNLRLFVNGTLGATSAESTNFTINDYWIGRSINGQYWNGYIDDLRVTKGIARYTANFTPPTSAHRLR